MSQSDRRRFLRDTFLATAGSLALPGMLASWCDQDGTAQDPPPKDPRVQDPPKKPTREELLRAAAQRAVAENKPLLVCVVPAEQNQIWYRGARIGAWLNHGGALALLEVGLCVPACATLAEVEKVTGAKAVAGDPVLLLVQPAPAAKPGEPEAPVKVTPIAPEFGAVPEVIGRGGVVGGNYEQALARENKYYEDGVEKTTAALHEALHGGRDNLASLAARVQANLAADDRSALDRWYAGGKVPTDALLVRATAMVRLHASRQDDTRRQVELAALQAAIEREYVKQRVPGSKWGHSQGCGTTIEPVPGDTDVGLGVACGMGHVPKVCERFLHLFSE